MQHGNEKLCSVLNPGPCFNTFPPGGTLLYPAPDFVSISSILPEILFAHANQIQDMRTEEGTTPSATVNTGNHVYHSPHPTHPPPSDPDAF